MNKWSKRTISFFLVVVMFFGVFGSNATTIQANSMDDPTTAVANTSSESAENTTSTEDTTTELNNVQNQVSQDVSSYFHASISTNNDTFQSGTTAIVSVRYTIDQQSATAGDYIIVSIPTDIANHVQFSLNAQHFTNSIDLGNGQYKLVLAQGIESGLSGSFSAYVSMHADTTTTDDITVGDASKTITVLPVSSSGGSGIYTDTIMKDAAGNDGVSFGGYDYSEGNGDSASQIGVADLSQSATIRYRLLINNKKGKISDFNIVDIIPDGMTLNLSKPIEVINTSTSEVIDPSLYSVQLSGQTLNFYYPGELEDAIQINYWVDIPEGSNTSKFTNTATITYTEDGSRHQENRSYVLQGRNNSASNGEKSVDKSIISSDPSDQYVTYTIKFWNSNGFAKNEIRLIDHLDPHVKYVSAESNDYFSIQQDTTNPQDIHITNIKKIEGSMTTYVRFVVDMTDVPIGYTVKNTVGGNTTKTVKYGGGLTLTANKTINGSQKPDKGQFNFQLLTSTGKVLQTKKNDENGQIHFREISYDKNDVGKTYTYTIKEVPGPDNTYTYDNSEYTVTVTPQLEYDASGNETGRILANPTYQKNGTNVDAITFDNQVATTSIPVSKKWEDANDQDGKRAKEVKVHLLADGKDTGKTVILNADNNWKASFNDVDAYQSGKKIQYTVSEDKVDGYTASISGNAKDGFVIKNHHQTEKVNISGKKTWSDNDNQDGTRPESIMIRLMANGTEIKTQEVKADKDGNWNYQFTDLPKYEKGQEIEYTVSEDAVADYSTTQSGYDFTNKHDPGKTSVNVKKIWEDAENQDGIRPEAITVQLLANGEKTDKTLTLNADNDWNGSFTDLDAKKKGKVIQYSIAEVSVPDGYKSVIEGNAIEGYIITNRHKTATIDISGKKTWSDNDNQDGKRPDKIIVHLMADGKEVQSKEVSGNWSYTFNDLPKYENGKEIKYTVQEDKVAGYTAKVEGYDLINTHKIEKTSIPVSKKWEDANDQDGKRAKEVKVHLLADGKDTGKTVILNADNNWKASFNDVDAYQSGKKIQYTVSEDKVDGYTASISGNTKDGFVITNKHVVVDTTVKEKPTKPKSTQTGVPMNMRVYSIMAILPLIGIILLKRKYS
ncbi:Cna B-type domain-containing protein [Absicoccus intestinalis]|uniref:Cna B-type domain-containing protein n=2 Tax=Absicoccus TaxID=2718525 RepID=A0ABU4WKL3_9FIRM|nr:Cna B-type domain-containing protein [Absicoccus sp. CLA-KB-P134]MDX8416606.1 Cna B-type domain-containing protein [Absicoccus sp. CLA-KB-P134]